VLVRVDALTTFSRKGGALYVEGGESTIPVINRVSASGYYDEVIDGQDDTARARLVCLDARQEAV